MAKYSIECGITSLANPGSITELVRLIKDSVKHALEYYGVDLTFIIYEGFSSTYSSGREKGLRHDTIFPIIRELNENGIDFMLPLNGGVSLPEMTQPDQLEIDALNMLNQNNLRMGVNNKVNNKVTVVSDYLYDIIREDFHHLGMIASCIRRIDPNHAAGYEEDLKKFDYVVPLNEHTSPDYLQQFMCYADKLILFLNHYCGSNNFERCLNHYVETELDV